MGTVSIQKGIGMLLSTNDGISMAGQYLNIEYNLDEEGYIDFMSPKLIQPVSWEEYACLPLRDFDVPIRTPHMVLRAPIVVMSRSKKVIMKELRPTKKNLYDFYGGKCIWTGEVIPFSQTTREHLLPKKYGGKETWENLAPASKEINNNRGHTLLKDFHIKPKYKISKPKAMPAAAMIREVVRNEWAYFLLNK